MVVTWHAGLPTWGPHATPPRCCGYGWRWCDSCPLVSCPTASSSNPAGIAQEGLNTSPHWTGNIAKYGAYDGRARVRSIMALPGSLPTYHIGSEAEWSLISRALLSSGPASLIVNDRMLDKRHYISGEKGGKNVRQCHDWVRWSVKQCYFLCQHLTFLTMALKNICSEGYTQCSFPSPPLGMLETSRPVERGKGWPGHGSWLDGGICVGRRCVMEFSSKQCSSQPFILV